MNAGLDESEAELMDKDRPRRVSGSKPTPLRVTHLRLVNWRNFKEADLDMPRRLFILGPNASGKSNLLDALRFLCDLTLDGGGLQQAIRERGGLARVRNLAARNKDKGRVTIAVSIGDDVEPKLWEYQLTLTSEKGGQRRPVVFEELVRKAGTDLLHRSSADTEDKELLTQTHMEQVAQNKEFREVVGVCASISYLHLVPQVIRDPGRAGERADDPYGGDFIARVARSPERERRRRLKFINDALKLAVPQLESLELQMDAVGKPHLQARYKHWRPNAGIQNEVDFSDGTLRLIGLLWMLQERASITGPILLEEPELSLHDAIVRQLPTLIGRAAQSSGRQVIVTTHAEAILEDEGLGLDEVVILSPSDEGTIAQSVAQKKDIQALVASGLNLREALQGEIVPQSISQLSLLPLS